MSQPNEMTPAQAQAGLNHSVVVLRQAIMQLAAASVQVVRLAMFSDYQVLDDDRKDLLSADGMIREALDVLSELEHRRISRVNGPVQDGWGNR